MNKYVTPVIKYEDVCVSDIMQASVVQIVALEGVDKEGETSAVFDASYWLNF